MVEGTGRRSVELKAVFAASAVLAAALVLLALPGRQSGERSDTDALLPLRNPTPEEAVVLLRTPLSAADTAITALTATEAELSTRYYVVAARAGMQTRALAADGKHAVTWATWDRYYSRYHVPRAALERALGEPLRVHPERSRQFASLTLSFDADHVPFYVASEIAFLTLWFSLFGLVVVRVPRLSLILPLLWPWVYLPVAFVLTYSPAFYDGDWFFQRVVVEHIALLSLFGGVVLALPAALSLLVYAVQRISELLAGRAQRGADAAVLSEHMRRYRRRAWLGVLAIALVLGVGWLGFYGRDRDVCLGELAALGKRLTPDRIGAVLALPSPLPRLPPGRSNLLEASDLPPGIRSAIMHILEVGAGPCRELQVYVRTGRAPDEYLFLSRNDVFSYADVRTLDDTFGQQIDAAFLSTLGPDPSCSLDSAPLCGRRVSVGAHEVTFAVQPPRH